MITMSDRKGMTISMYDLTEAQRINVLNKLMGFVVIPADCGFSIKYFEMDSDEEKEEPTSDRTTPCSPETISKFTDVLAYNRVSREDVNDILIGLDNAGILIRERA